MTGWGGLSGWALRMLVAALVLSPVVATAQTQPPPQVISPLQLEPDENGVNLITGQIQLTGPVLEIPAAPRLRYDLIQNLAPYVNGTRTGSPGEYSEGSYSIHTGRSKSEAFRCLFDDNCISETGSGSRFTPGIYRFVEEGTGAVWLFTSKQSELLSGGGSSTQIQYYATRVDYPDGEIITYEYHLTPSWGGIQFHRPTKVSSNLGYHIAITYHTNDLYADNWGVPAQVTIVQTSNPTVPLARLSYSANGQVITDLDGRTFQCSQCMNWVGGGVESYFGSTRLPGETTDNITVTGFGSTPVVGTIVRDGVQWNYNYSNLQYSFLLGSWVYDAITVTGPNGFQKVYNFVTVQGYDSSYGRRVISKITDSLGRITEFTYDGYYRPTSVKYPEGNRVEVVYGPAGYVSDRTAVAKPASGLASITQQVNFVCGSVVTVACFRPNWYRDGRGAQTDFVYNARGQLTSETVPANAAGVRAQTIREYQLAANGLSRNTVVRVCAVGSTCGTNQEFRTEHLFWGNTNLHSEVRQVDASTGQFLGTSFTYDAAGRVTAEDGPLAGNGDAKFYRYDVLGRRTWEIGPAGVSGVRPAKRTTYRASDDKPVIIEEGTVPDQNSNSLTLIKRTDITYDTRRNAAVEAVSGTGSALVVTQRSYDSRNRLECEARRMNPAVFGALPASACSLGTAGTQGPDRITRNVYDSASQLLKVQKAYGTTLQQDYATYTYSANGKQRSLTDARGYRAEMEYDGHDRQTKWIFPSKTATGVVNTADYEQYGYDANGNRTSFRKRDGSTLTYQYDNLNRVTRKTVPERAGLAAIHTRDVFYEYDIRGLETKARFDSLTGDGITTAYDRYGRATDATISMAGLIRTLTSAYDVGSRRTRLTHPDGIYFDMQYDPAARLTAALWTAPGSSNYSFLSQSYDSLGRRTLASRGAPAVGRTSYAYDALSRLTTQGQVFAGGTNNVSHGFSYNPASQITARTQSNDAYRYTGHIDVNRAYAVNGLNQYTTAGPASFTYDANGNLTSDGTVSYTYDVENRLVASSAGAQLVYDPKGRLFEVSSGGQVTRFVHDGDLMAVEYNGAGAVTRRFMFAGVDEPILEDSGGALNCSGTRFLHTNHQGSIIAHADCWGNRTNVNAYDEYGIPQAGNTGRFQYTGQAWLPEIGMYYYKARIYSPTLGRFLQIDPIGYEDQVNLYAYVANDPINKIDPSGKWIAVAVRSLGQACMSSAFCATAVAGLLTTIGNTLANEEAEAPEDQPDTQSEASDGENTNPYKGPVKRPVIVVDEAGNAIPVSEGEQVTSSPNGDYQQVRDSQGRETGVRQDRGGHRGQSDPAAQKPHAHRPGVTQDDGNPHLPIRPRPRH